MRCDIFTVLILIFHFNSECNNNIIFNVYMCKSEYENEYIYSQKIILLKKKNNLLNIY